MLTQQQSISVTGTTNTLNFLDNLIINTLTIEQHRTNHTKTVQHTKCLDNQVGELLLLCSTDVSTINICRVLLTWGGTSLSNL